MLKKVLVITASLRKGGNSELLADEFIKGVQEAGHTVEKIGLYGKTVNFCKGCLAFCILGTIASISSRITQHPVC